MTCLNVLMETPRRGKIAFNLSLPPELMEEFDRVMQRFGPKKKWAGFAAAVLLLLEIGDDGQDQRIGEVFAADASNKFNVLLDRARTRVKSQKQKGPKIDALVADTLRSAKSPR